jgi:hypothetical protein
MNAGSMTNLLGAFEETEVKQTYVSGPIGEAEKAMDIIDDVANTATKYVDQINELAQRGASVSANDLVIVTSALAELSALSNDAAYAINDAHQGKISWETAASDNITRRNRAQAILADLSDVLAAVMTDATNKGLLEPGESEVIRAQLAATGLSTEKKSLLMIAAALVGGYFLLT